jgi:peptidoglycan-associated lipoprotein
MSCAIAPAWSSDQWDKQIFRDRTVYFQTGRIFLTKPAQRQVAEIAKYLRAYPATALQIDGHCDDRGSEEYNRDLGEKRAQSVRRELIRLGVAPDRIDTVSYGEDKPLDPGHNSKAWRRNRRAEFILWRPPGG